MRPAAPDAFLAALREEASASSADALEFAGDFCSLDAGYGAATWQEAARILQGAGLAATVHLPFVWVDIAALDRQVWEGSLRSLERAAEAMRPLRPRLAALHPANCATQTLLTAAPESARPLLLLTLAERVVTALKRLQAGPLGGVIGLENLEGLPLPLFEAVAQQAGSRICFDFGHALSDGADPVTAFAGLRERAVGVHLHDAKPGRAHLPLGEGDLDLGAVKAALADFDGPVVLELDGRCEESLARLLTAP
jgi:sugar phosphate isomerase/epimerase